MRTILLAAILPLLYAFSLTAQPELLPQIGVDTEPAASTPICNIPTFLGPIHESGYDEGSVVNDFSLYTPEGERYQLSQVLASGKPVLLISAAYTCWRFRDQVASINAVANFYGEDISTFIVYTVEAHPHISVSPYSMDVWTGERNFTDNILYEQPTTYGERLEIIEDMTNEMAIVPEILVDDPCNQWWSHFGPAPNNAYLIDASGVVRVKHGWLNSYPDDLWCDIADYFNEESEYCNEAGNNGTFEVTFDSEGENTAYGTPGDVLTIPTTIHNLSETENVEIDIQRQNVYTQPDWNTALCINVCYNWTVSSATVTIPPGGEQSFIFYFYTGDGDGVGTAEVQFTNAYNPLNNEILGFSGITGITTGINDKQDASLKLFPNPASSILQLQVSSGLMGNEYEMYDGQGRSVGGGVIQAELETIEVDDLQAGLYFLRIAGIDEVQQIAIK